MDRAKRARYLSGENVAGRKISERIATMWSSPPGGGHTPLRDRVGPEARAIVECGERPDVHEARYVAGERVHHGGQWGHLDPRCQHPVPRGECRREAGAREPVLAYLVDGTVRARRHEVGAGKRRVRVEHDLLRDSRDAERIGAAQDRVAIGGECVGRRVREDHEHAIQLADLAVPAALKLAGDAPGADRLLDARERHAVLRRRDFDVAYVVDQASLRIGR